MGDYYDELAAEFYDLEPITQLGDLDYWKSLVREYVPTGGGALELACGTLRVLLPVAESGCTVWGLDASSSMLDKGRQKLKATPEVVRNRVQLFQADMRTFELGRRFHLIYVPFNSLLHLTSIEDQLAFLASAKRHLEPGGALAFDISVMHSIKSSDQWELELDCGNDQVRFQRERVRQADPLHQLVHNVVRMKEYRKGLLAREWVNDFTWTYLLPRELEHLVARAGFEFIHFFSDYDRADFKAARQPEHMLPVLRPVSAEAAIK